MHIRRETYLAHQILSLVANHYEVSLKELICGKSGNARLARGGAVYAIRTQTNLPLLSIAALLGYDTTEVLLYALKQHEVDMRNNSHLQHVQQLVENFVSAAIDLQVPSEREDSIDIAPDDPAWLIDDILDELV